MITQTAMKAALQQYLDGFNNKDHDAVISLFADNARIEDPVGGGQIIEGKEAITSFYQSSVASVEKLELAAPIRGSHGNSAALAFIINVEMEGKKVRIHCIDVMTFNDEGKIADMKAYWGQEDIQFV
ncbi:steroid delta-isomerase [Bacillus sp. FJAT-18019]|uniref:Steroid delta-isomerase n=1 Tax=Paenibacillus solani TaxID=1705565 RepID=A0A0M1NJU0_9BACL|nr:steroid Delta-isomerase [Paenibacillus solani]KOP66737.1 steroid delta-isomerase [Bacillus sp. FJAT-18019]KOR82451.1 steroid delta-isomerase [Paenibacillus solani]